MGPRTFVVDLAKGPLNRSGIRAGGRQIQQLEARVGSQPRLDFLGCMQLRIGGDHGKLRKEGRRMGPIERVQQCQEEARLFPLPPTLRNRPGRNIQGPGQVPFLMGARGEDCHLFALGHPLIPHLRQQIDIQLIGKE
jgi:hypothetical protein